jgi:hypothetical protein
LKVRARSQQRGEQRIVLPYGGCLRVEVGDREHDTMAS